LVHLVDEENDLINDIFDVSRDKIDVADGVAGVMKGTKTSALRLVHVDFEVVQPENPRR